MLLFFGDPYEIQPKPLKGSPSVDASAELRSHLVRGKHEKTHTAKVCVIRVKGLRKGYKIESG